MKLPYVHRYAHDVVRVIAAGNGLSAPEIAARLPGLPRKGVASALWMLRDRRHLAVTRPPAAGIRKRKVGSSHKRQRGGLVYTVNALGRQAWDLKSGTKNGQRPTAPAGRVPGRDPHAGRRPLVLIVF